MPAYMVLFLALVAVVALLWWLFGMNKGKAGKGQ